MKLSHSDIAVYLFLFIAFVDVVGLVNVGITVINLDSITYIAMVVVYLTLLHSALIAVLSHWRFQVESDFAKAFSFYLIYMLLMLLLGLPNAQDYWDYKNLFLTDIPYGFMVVLCSYGMDRHIVKSIVSFILKYYFLLCLPLIPYALQYNIETYSRLVIVASLLIFFAPYVDGRKIIIMAGTIILSVILAPEFRANLVKVIFALAVMAAYYAGVFRDNYIYIWAQRLLFVVPVTLLGLGANDLYNVFKLSDERFNIVTSAGTEENMLADSRTFIYREISRELDNDNAWLLGKGLGGAYKSSIVYAGEAWAKDRYSSEVGFMNRVLKTGIFGVIAYTLLLYITTRDAIMKSNNNLAKLLGLAVASRWAMSFIEEYSRFDINNVMTVIIMGLSCSKWFREMTDDQVKGYLRAR